MVPTFITFPETSRSLSPSKAKNLASAKAKLQVIFTETSLYTAEILADGWKLYDEERTGVCGNGGYHTFKCVKR